MHRWMLWLTLSLAACGGEDPAEGGHPGGHGQRPDPVTVVDVAEASAGSVAHVLVSSAVVESERAADVLPQTTGLVVRVAREEGDAVRAGELLAELENVSLDANAERTKADRERVEAEVAALERLAAQGAISAKELDDARYRLATARTAEREARGSAGYTRLVAPFAGVVAARDVKQGELASSAKRAFQVVDPNRLRVVVSLPERDLAKVREGQPVRLTSAYDPDISAEGVVARVAPVVDPTSGTFRVTIGMPPGPGALRPGQFVSVAIEVERHEEVLTVPRRALTYEDGRPIAWRMIPEPPKEPKADDKSTQEDKAPEEATEGGGWFAWLGGAPEATEEEGPKKPRGPKGPKFVAERVPVKLGLVDAERAEIVEGLAAGDQVITVGQATLRDGATVRTPAMQAEAKKAEEEARAAEAAEGGEEG